jgi:DNA polymerase (family 10)
MSLAQLLSTQKGTLYKVKAYRRAAKKIKAMSESIEELVRQDADLTRYSGIGKGISSAIREIVLSGTLGKLEELRSHATPETASITDFPRLDPQRVRRIYKKLNISTVAELKQKLDSGAVAEAFGSRMDQHVRQALTESHEMLLYDADHVAQAGEAFLLRIPGVKRAQIAGDCRRRVEVVEEISFLVETDNFPELIKKMERYGGKAQLLSSSEHGALFRLPSGSVLRIDRAYANNWGLALIASTGSANHLQKLNANFERLNGDYASEEAVYRTLGLSFIEPELREGHDEIELARRGELPTLVTVADVRGELHAHTTSSDGSNTIEQMATGARNKGYEYIGISDHSQSLKIARGVSEQDLWKQIRYIDKFNQTSVGIRVLKSAEVDILANGSLDYPDELLKELDYTVCSIHSRFGLDRAKQTERILRAMDNRYFTILGHATGRLLLKRPGYEIDIQRIIEHAKTSGCFFEINSSPDRLDLSAENTRLASAAGVRVAITTDAHSIREFEYIRGGVDQARRAGLDKASVLNCLSWEEFSRLARR